MKIDLKAYGLIDLGKRLPWRRMQFHSRDNLAKLIADTCICSGVGAVCIPSCSARESIPGSEDDRFKRICDDAFSLPSEYVLEIYGGEFSQMLRIIKGGEQVLILNGQEVVSSHNNRRVDFTAIGVNSIPNGKTLEEAIQDAKQRGLLVLCQPTKGLYRPGRNDVKDLIGLIDAFYVSPVTTEEKRKLTMQLGEQLKVPVIAVSNSHSPSGIGGGAIEVEDSKLDKRKTSYLVNTLAGEIRNRRFQNHLVTKPSVGEMYATALLGSWAVVYEAGKKIGVFK